MTIVSIETHGITDAMLSGSSTRIESCCRACVSRHLDDAFVVVAYRCGSISLCQSRKQHDCSIMIVSIERHGISRH
jgi:hypothetical protein